MPLSLIDDFDDVGVGVDVRELGLFFTLFAEGEVEGSLGFKRGRF